MSSSSSVSQSRVTVEPVGCSRCSDFREYEKEYAHERYLEKPDYEKQWVLWANTSGIWSIICYHSTYRECYSSAKSGKFPLDEVVILRYGMHPTAIHSPQKASENAGRKEYITKKNILLPRAKELSSQGSPEGQIRQQLQEEFGQTCSPLTLQKWLAE